MGPARYITSICILFFTDPAGDTHRDEEEQDCEVAEVKHLYYIPLLVYQYVRCTLLSIWQAKKNHTVHTLMIKLIVINSFNADFV